MEKIIKYIKNKYDPLAIIVYGSYANGTNNLNSDFDALVISARDTEFHDTSFADDVQLDVFVYPSRFFEGGFECEDFVRIFDGIIVMDTDDVGVNLKNKVLAYIENKPEISKEQIAEDITWCVKMCDRVKRNDAEGLFRFHWLLVDSLEIFCNAVHQMYRGPKKSLKWMQENHPEAFVCYQKALSDFSVQSLNAWVDYLQSLISGE